MHTGETEGKNEEPCAGGRSGGLSSVFMALPPYGAGGEHGGPACFN